MYLLSDPAQRRVLVLQPVVAGVRAQGLVRQEAEDPEPVIHRDHDDVTLPGDQGTVQGTALDEAAEVDVDHHRQPGAGDIRRPVDAQIQAVLAGAGDAGLGALGAGLGGLERRIPGRVRLRGLLAVGCDPGRFGARQPAGAGG
jgi:hypothetical protein